MALLLPVAGCGRSGDEPDGARADESAITVLYCCGHEVFGPSWDMPAKYLVFQPLATMGADGELEGRLAHSWEHSEDFLDWTIHLRSDVTWHDGVPFTARDVEFTLDLLRHPEVLAIPSSFEVRVIDDTTLTMRLEEDSDFDPLDEWVTYYPEHLLRDLDPAVWYNWDFWVSPVGTGGFRYVRHEPNVMTEFVAYADYYRGRPQIDRVTLKYAESSVTELLSRNVDALGWPRNEDISAISSDPDYAVYYETYPSNYRAILWNQRVPALRDPVVRRALTLAIDRAELHEILLLPSGTPYFDVPFTRRQFFRGQAPAPLSHDPAAATALLDGAGWVDEDGDGIRMKEGKPLSLDLLVSAEEAKGAVFVQQELAEVGVAVRIDQLDLNIVRRRTDIGDFDALSRIFHMGPTGRYGTAALYGTESILGYENPEVAELLTAAPRTPIPDSVDALYRKTWPHFQRDLPMTYLSPGVRGFVAHRKVRGLQSGTRADIVANLEYLWIETNP